MLITKVELHNVKSYGDLEAITFTEGVNAICGPNGAGKSTILEAIGFALFDALSYRNQGQFIHEGAKQGHIAVSFIDALDDREYQVVRPLGGGPPYVNDPLTKKRVASGKQDVFDWLRDHLGVTPTTDLKTLFTDAVGIPQGMLTTSFLERAGIRKGKFDPLLQVDEYEAVWEKLRESIRYLDGSKRTKDLEAAELHSRLSRLPALEEEKSDLAAQLASTRSELQATEDELLSAAAGKKRLDDIEKQVSELDSLIKQLREREKSTQERITVANSELHQAKQALTAVESSREGYTSFEEAQIQLAELESRRVERDLLKEEVNKIEQQLALLAQRITADKQSLESIQESEVRIAELQPDGEEQERLETELKMAEITVARLADSEKRLSSEMEAKERLQTTLTRAKEELDQRSALSAEYAELSSSIQNTMGEISLVDDKIALLNSDLEEARKQSEAAHVRSVEEELAFTRLSEAEAEVNELRIKQAEIFSKLELRDDLEARLAGFRSSLSDSNQELASLQTNESQIAGLQSELQEKIEALATADVADCPVCQQPLTPEHIAHVTSGYENQLAALAQRLVDINEQRQKARQLIRSSEKSIEAIEQQLSQLPAPGRSAEIVEDLQNKLDLVAKLKTETERLAGASDEAELVDQRLGRLGDENSQLKAMREKLDQERTKTDDQSRQIQEKLSALATAERVEEIETAIKQIDSVIAEIQGSIEKMDDVAQERERIVKDLESLGNPLQEITKLSAIVSEKPALIEAIMKMEEKKIAINGSVEVKKLELEPYAGLDVALSDQSQILEENRASHERYLSNIQTAEKVPEREVALQSLTQDSQAVKDKRVAATTSFEQVQASYNREEHEKVISRHAALSALEAQLNERSRGFEGQLVKVDKEITALHEDRVQLETTLSQIEELNSLQTMVAYIRKTIREAGPLITRRLVSIISDQANRMYGDIMADHSTTLEWEIDYGITVEHKGERRDFRQLSGGEQMAAALAVRLALLREMSGIRIAFFDEPTAHLDDERRENLAQQITQIKGFNQLFVISHDDTFERETHHVIRVSKVNGSSHVEVA